MYMNMFSRDTNIYCLFIASGIFMLVLLSNLACQSKLLFNVVIVQFHSDW